jgi:hypothetical protein
MALLDELRRRYPEIGEYAGTDPDLVKEKRLPVFQSTRADLAMGVVRASRRISRLLQQIRGR